MWFCDPKSRINNKLEQRTSKKIFFLVGYIFPPEAYGGGNLIHRKLYEHVKEKGTDVIYISMGDILALLGRGWRRWLFSPPFFGKILANPWFCWQLRHCKGIIFTDHYFNQYLLLFKFMQRYFLKSSIIISFFHSDYYRNEAGLSLKKIYIKFRERLAFNLGHRIITISKHAKNEVISLAIPPSKIDILYPGFSASEFSRYQKNESDKINLLFVGHCRPRKGLEYFIEACAKLKNNNFIVNIVARKENPAYFQKLQDLVAKNNLKDKFIFHGEFLQNEEGRRKLSYQYSQANIFVFPSLWEGFGIVLLEAMFYKLPIVASNISAIPELVKDGENGILVPPGNSEALAEAISCLVENPTLRKEMGEKGYKRVVDSYSWQSTGEKFYQMVRELDNGRRYTV